VDENTLPEKWEGAEQQLLFAEGAELLTVEEDARQGKYSGKIIEKHRAKVSAICNALAGGIGIIRIARAFGVSEHTVMAIRDRHPELIAMEEKELSRTYGKILKLSAERYLEALVAGSIHPAQLPVGMGIVFDKKALLDGKPTQIVHHQEKDLTVEDLNRLFESMKVAKVAPVLELEENSSESDSQSGGESGKAL
jgi:hypothetical protein